MDVIPLLLILLCAPGKSNEDLVTDLAADRWRARQFATAQLVLRGGGEAIPACWHGLRSRDFDVHLRCERILAAVGWSEAIPEEGESRWWP